MNIARFGYCIPLLVTLAGCHASPQTSDAKRPPKQPNPYVGTYSVTSFINGKPVDNSTLPPGQRRILELKSDSKWVMGDMLSGLEGTWLLKNGKVVLTPLLGPAGKLKDQTPLILEPKPDRTHLVLVSPPKLKGMMECQYDPAITRKINDAMRDRMSGIHN